MSTIISIEALGAILPPSIDLYLTSASFESRSVSASRGVSKCDVKKALIFYANEYAHFSLENVHAINALFDQKAKITELNVNDPIHVADSFVDEFERATNNSTSITVVIDATTFTRESLLILLSIVHKYRNKIGVAKLVYTRAKEMSNEWLSKGVVDYRSILGYLGEISPLRRLHLILMTGFEVERAWNIVSKYEPDLVSIGIGAKDNSISMEFYERNCKFAKELESLFGVAVGHFEFSLTDPYETGAALIAYIDSHNGNYNTVVAPLNNKLSTIGAGLAAIKNKNIQLCYAQPEAYNAETYSVPDENCYVVDIQINEWEQ